MGDNGRSYVKKYYSWSIVIDKYRKAFEFLGFDSG
jgi:hypothetical protein